MKEVSAILVAANDTSTPKAFAGKFTFSLRGAWAGTVKVQRSYDQGETWGDVKSYTVNAEETGDEGEGALYRAIFSTATSGQASVRFGQ